MGHEKVPFYPNLKIIHQNHMNPQDPIIIRKAQLFYNRSCQHPNLKKRILYF